MNRYSLWVVVRAPDGTVYFAPSRWKNAKGVLLLPPLPLSFATASNQAVVDADGQVDNTGRVTKVAPVPHIETPEH
jgi:hypothetical protein